MLCVFKVVPFTRERTTLGREKKKKKNRKEERKKEREKEKGGKGERGKREVYYLVFLVDVQALLWVTV